MRSDKVYDFIFVVLVYRNTQDLIDFFDSLNLHKCKVIVVNSFYDENSENSFREIATRHHADFFSVPNKGYGYGNNRGIKYAIKHYEFKYLIISNADITIEHFDYSALEKDGYAIVAPKILTINNKNQNPSVPFKPFRCLEKLKRDCFKHRHRHLILLIFAYSRLTKYLFYAINPFRKKIFSAHGAFFIIPKKTLLKLVPLYNENMFMFNEEEHLGRLARQKGTNIIYEPKILIRHKEDGSVKLASFNEFEEMRLSYLKYYDYWN